MAPDMRTSKIFGEIGNSIFPFIRLTTDYPSKYPSGYMPLLDIQVRMNCMNKVEYLFYSKPMSSPFLILYSSAMPNKVKRNCLIQEGVRRLRNTSRNTDWSVKADILSQFCNKMYVSGYPKKYRLEVIQAAVGCYNKQCERADQGVRPLHRGRNFQK